MATVFGVKNRLHIAKYQNVNVIEGQGTSFCGWGVRDRGADFLNDRTVLCKNWSAEPGTTIRWLRLRTGSVGGAGEFKITFWQRAIGAINYTNRGVVTIDETDVDDGVWVADTDYALYLGDTVSFNTTVGSECLLSVYADAANVAVLSYTADTGSDDAKIESSDVSGDSTYDWDSEPDSPFAVSIEAFNAATSLVDITEGGTMEEENTNWTDGDWDSANWNNVANITADDAAVADSDGTTGGYISIDLNDGATSIDPWVIGFDGFPKYAFTGVRAVSKIVMEYEIKTHGPLEGGLSISYSDIDDPGQGVEATGWEEIWQDTTNGAGVVVAEIEIPVVARWIKIEEIGDDTDEIDYIEIYQMRYRITDGEFDVRVSDDPHKVWVENYPTTDKLYYFTVSNNAGSTSQMSSPMSNRRLKD